MPKFPGIQQSHGYQSARAPCYVVACNTKYTYFWHGWPHHDKDDDNKCNIGEKGSRVYTRKKGKMKLVTKGALQRTLWSFLSGVMATELTKSGQRLKQNTQIALENYWSRLLVTTDWYRWPKRLLFTQHRVPADRGVPSGWAWLAQLPPPDKYTNNWRLSYY